MKKILAATLIVSSVSAYANTPSLYGTVNLEYLQLDQDDKFMTTSGGGVFNVRGAESRIGARGNYDFETYKVGYRVELGLDSTQNPGESNGVSGRIRIRLASADVSGKWGKLTMGQDTTATSAVVTSYDPLANTTLGLSGLSQSEIIRGATIGNTNENYIQTDLGMKFRTRRDVIKYQTPSFYGLTWTTSMDRNDNSQIEHNKGGDTHYENLLAYSREMGSLNMTAHVGHITWSNIETENENVLMYGLRLSHASGLGFNFLYTTEEEEEKLAANEKSKTDITRMMGSLYYKWDKNQLALTYGKRDSENQGRSGLDNKTEDGDKFSTTQIAAGYKHFASKNVEFKATVGQIKHEEDDAALAKLNDNKATVVAVGMALSF